MPVVLVVTADWTMRTAIRAELHERSIDALGIDSADDVVRTLASGRLPDAIILEATAELLGDPGIQDLSPCFLRGRHATYGAGQIARHLA
jgi:hypothetical protein